MNIPALMLATVSLCSPGLCATIPLQPQDVDDWLLHVVPLPKQVALHSKVTVPVAELCLVGTSEHGPATGELKTWAAELREAGLKEMPSPDKARLLIIAGPLAEDNTLQGHAVPEADRLRQAGNADQAYSISNPDDRTVLVAGDTPVGAYYGILTLRQLMMPTLRQGDAGATIEAPLGSILDWPDLAERGLWGGSANRDIEWMAQRKMNLVESHCKGLTVTDEGLGLAEFDKTLIERGARCGVKVVPIVTHLDQLERTGLFRVFPETLGEGDPEKWPYGGTTVRPACFSNPRTARALADWIVSLASQPEVTDISVWLSEHHVACACDKCREKGQFVLEAEAVNRGYELALEARPDIKLRVLLTQGSYQFNDQVISALSPEIGITYYDGGRTYDSSRNPMIYPLLEQYAAQGGWLGCYPQLTASWRIVCPWTGPQFIKARMVEFVDKGLQCLCGYATPDNRYYDFNVTAAAEWSWNAHGRDERQFARAYFTKKGLADPTAAADWAVSLGPVGWDLYGARVPYSWFFGGAAKAVASRSIPDFGTGPFLYYGDAAALEADLALSAAACAGATGLGDAALLSEARAIDGYLRMLQAIVNLGSALGKDKELSEPQKQAAAAAMAALDAATMQTVEGLRAWHDSVAPGTMPSRLEDTIEVTESTCSDIATYLGTVGVPDPQRAYRRQTVGAWATEDFADSAEITGEWDVTDAIDGPGRYRVQFVYKSGWYGLGIHRLRLLATPAQGEPTLVASDEHEGTAAHRNVNNVYELNLPAHDPAMRYSLSADIRGMPADHPQDKQGCNGEIWMQKVRDN